jgi:anti-sigma-K factor RskA
MSPDIHTLTGAYAAAALPPDERARFEAHLAECDDCAQEIRELLETTTLLGVAAATAAPPQLRERVMAEVARTRQLPPLVPPLVPTRPAAGPSRRPARREGRARWERRIRRWALTTAACLAVVVIGLGAFAFQLYREAEQSRQLANRVAAVLTAPDVRSVTATSDGSTATVVVSRQRSEMVFLARGLPGAPGRHEYQLWMIGPSGPRSAGLLGPSGRVPPLILRGPADANALGVTVEPTGGSRRPTTDPVLLVRLPQA